MDGMKPSTLIAPATLPINPIGDTSESQVRMAEHYLTHPTLERLIRVLL